MELTRLLALNWARRQSVAEKGSNGEESCPTRSGPEMDNEVADFISYFSSQMLFTLVEREGELTLVPD